MREPEFQPVLSAESPALIARFSARAVIDLLGHLVILASDQFEGRGGRRYLWCELVVCGQCRLSLIAGRLQAIGAQKLKRAP